MQPALPVAQPTTSGQALQDYNSFTSGMQTPQSIVQGADQSTGVTGAQQQVSGLRQAITNTTNLLNQVAPSVYGKTQNSLVTNAQATGQIAAQDAPIQTKLSGLNTSEGNASSDLTSAENNASTLAGAEQTGQTAQQTALMDLYKTLSSNETNSSQAQEAIREFNASNAIAQQNANTSASSAASSAAKSATPTATQGDIATSRGDLIKSAAGDGYVSPQAYAQIALQWANAGYSLKDFNTNFAKYKNPQNPNYTI